MDKQSSAANFDLLLACLSSKPERLIEHFHANKTVDWAGFIAMVYWHRVAPAVYDKLKVQPSLLVPSSVTEELKSHVAANTRKLLRLSAELVNLTQGLAAEAIPSLTLKGPPLSLQLYGNLTSRECRDIDILISPDQLVAAHSFLIKQGYQCSEQINSFNTKQYSFYLRSRKDAAYHHYGRGVHLELHWQLCEDPRQFPYGLKDLISETACVSIGGVWIRTLAPLENILYLSAHGSSHSWSNLYWLTDINAILGQQNLFDWNLVFRRSRELNVHLQFLEGMLLTQRIMEAVLPREIEEAIRGEKYIAALVKTTLKIMRFTQLRSATIFRYKIIRLFRLKLLGRGMSRRLFRWIFWQMPIDWSLIKLPERLFFLYYPFRLLLALQDCLTKVLIRKSTRASN